jgi:DNA polymerase III subunit gamma/tau
VVLQDLLELAHLLTRAKLVPDPGRPGLPEDRAPARRGLAEKLSSPPSPAWQMLLKGLGEVQQAAPVPPLQAAEMVLIRLATSATCRRRATSERRRRGDGARARRLAVCRRLAPSEAGNGGAPVEARGSSYEMSAPGPGGDGGPQAALARPVPAPLPEPERQQESAPQGLALRDFAAAVAWCATAARASSPTT